MIKRCRIEELIKKSGLRKDFIAKQLKCTTRQLRNYERQVSILPMDKAYILAKLLNVKLDELYEVEEDCSDT